MRAAPSRFATWVATASLLATLAAPRALAQATPPDSAIRAVLRTRVDSGTTAGIVVGVLENGKRRFISYGSAGPGRPPLDEHTIFEIGSISKTFTSLLLAESIVRGEVRLDQPVAELLPAGTVVPSRDGRQITLEHLATHRSGLPRLPDNLTPAAPADPYADYDTRRLYAFLASHQLRRTPGESVEYSNLGGGLLGHALTLRTHAPSWAALVEQRITGPLGMRETFVDAPAALRARVSAGHDAEVDTVPAWHLDALAGAGALRSTASDMLTYLSALLDTTQGPLARAAALVQQPHGDFAAGMRIGLGWLQAAAGPRPIWWHNGGTGGFRTIAAFDPGRRVGVVVLSNSSVSVDDIGMHLLNSALPVGLPIRAPRTPVTLAREALDRVTGSYELSPGFVLTVTRIEDGLVAQATGQPRLPMAAISANHFVIPVANAELVFDISEPGPAKHVTLRQNGSMVTAARKP
jgi:CubicO group peptidase (beta-lactamase class C family)